MSHNQFSIDIHNCYSMDPQMELGVALVKGNLGHFREALERGANPMKLDDQHINVFEMALKTYGKVDFVQECLSHGCDPNYVNPHFNKGAINFAADSRDPEILRALLYFPELNVNRKFAGLTPMNSLAKNLSEENSNDVCVCLKMLLDYGASPNLADQREMTPLLYVLKNKKLDELKKRELVAFFLERNDLDLDTYRDGEARELLTRLYPDFRLPERIYDSEMVTYETLLRDLRYEEEDKFLQHYQDYQLNISEKDNQKNTYQEDNLSLTIEAIRRGQMQAFEVLMERGVDINGVHKGNTPVQVAASWGNHLALARLLKLDALKIRKEDQLLITVLRKLNSTPWNDFSDYQKCFDLLLDSKLVDVNETDHSGTSALHYAVVDRNTKAILDLLKKGAYFGIKSDFGDLPIEALSTEVLEQHFDSCITTNGAKCGDSNLEIIMNYKNLIPPTGDHSHSIANKHLVGEMAPIAFIAESKEHRRLLAHPLITSFLFLKWNRYSIIFYLNFFIYFLFALSLMAFTFLKFRMSEYESTTNFFGLMSWIGILYLIVREALQFLMSPTNYLRSAINYMEVALILFAVLTCIESTYDNQTQRFIAVLTILLISIELCLLVGSLPVLSISTHMLMLKEVSRTFMKSFALYSIFVITFSLAFYIMFGKVQMKGKDDDDAGKEEDDEAGDSDFNTFQDPLVALIKTIVMFTGEFDAGDLKFYTFYNYLVFLVFVIFMSIVLLNLLNGLAVSDTQAIKAQAELNGTICRANLLTRFESSLTGSNGQTSFLFKTPALRALSQRFLRVHPNEACAMQISIYPNDNNKVMLPLTHTYEMSKLNSANNNNKGKGAKFSEKISPAALNGGYRTVASDSDNMESQKRLLDTPCCCCGYFNRKCSTMDGRTVKMALQVIDKKMAAHRELQREQEQQQVLQEIRQLLKEIRAK